MNLDMAAEVEVYLVRGKLNRELLHSLAFSLVPFGLDENRDRGHAASESLSEKSGRCRAQVQLYFAFAGRRPR
jgi:hypothetical protein